MTGAHVCVAEVDEIKAMEASVEGFRVGSVKQMISGADIVIIATGSQNVVGESAINRMRDGALLANAGHFDWEIDLAVIDTLTVEKTPFGHTIERHVLEDGRTVDVIARGRMMNLAGAHDEIALLRKALKSRIQDLIVLLLLGRAGDENDGTIHLGSSASDEQLIARWV